MANSKLRARPALRPSGLSRGRHVNNLSHEFWKAFVKAVDVSRGSGGAGSRTIECAGWLWLYIYTGRQEYLDQYRLKLGEIVTDSDKRQQMDERLRCAALKDETK